MGRHQRDPRDWPLYTWLVIGSILLGASIALVVNGFIRANEPTSDVHFVTPHTVPISSYDGRGFVAPSKSTLIIQQNPSCWLAAPGVKCGENRTYV